MGNDMALIYFCIVVTQPTTLLGKRYVREKKNLMENKHFLIH